RLRFLGSWRFYPMTYAFLESTLDFNSYSAESESDAASSGNLVPGSPFRIYAGLSGYVTERLSLLARVGYGNSMLDRDDNFSSFVGMLQASWRFGPRTVLHVGVARDYDTAPLGGYVDYIRPYAAFTQRFGELAELNIDFSYDFRSYGAWQPTAVEVGDDTVTPVVSDRNRSEQMIRAGVLIDFDITRLLGVTIGYRYDSIISDYSITTNGVTNFTAYDDHRLFATLNLRY
ncbi:MAG: hypothetical protein JNJ59_04160, partial [Deltaproteobacteria bacterium]|nr:hypothetical protein [Deltaproteobacteria bacterium]